MRELPTTWIGTNTRLHGKGEVGGKGEGLALIDELELSLARGLRTEVLTTDLYARYRDNGDAFDRGILRHIRAVKETFGGQPIGVRGSEEHENDPFIATSGQSISYMLPNCHSQPDKRFDQLIRAIRLIFESFKRRMEAAGRPNSMMAVLVNPIPGVASNTAAGPVFYPMSSGVADSFFKYPLTLASGPQNPAEGFARVAFGHGYAVVRDDFEVIPLATVQNPISPELVSLSGQQYFYALSLNEQLELTEDELSTMKMLHTRFADPAAVAHFMGAKRKLNFARLVDDDLLGYRRSLHAIMDRLHKETRHFQIEFTWNVFDGEGVFHIVQFKKLRDPGLDAVAVPPVDERTLVATDQVQGHGVIEGIRHAIVINPFRYSEDMHDDVVRTLAQQNQKLKQQGQRYLLICPGRLGTTNRKWGFNIPYESISEVAVVIEYGYDINGSPAIRVDRDDLTGGVYGSHFLYQILGGADEAERARRARLFGSQGTHFLTNLYTTGALYLFVNPTENHLHRWFFSPPDGAQSAAVYVKELDVPVTAYANLFERKCVIAEGGPDASSPGIPMSQPPLGMRVLNPHKVSRVYVFAASKDLRAAARRMRQLVPNCRVTLLSDPADLGKELYDRTFVLFLDEGGLALFDRTEFKKHNPSSVVVLLSSDLRVGCAPTQAEVLAVFPLAQRADMTFYVDREDCQPVDVMPAIVRAAEDKHNIEYHKSAERFIFLVVDDELRWFGQFLPVLYRIIGQRADVLLARTYEEAQAIMDEHGSDIVCLITDIYFPKGGVVTPEAGRELVRTTRRERPRIPIIIASKTEEAQHLQDTALILPKGDPEAVRKLDEYVHDFTGLGDFLLYRGDQLWRRISTLEELLDAVEDAPVDILAEYAAKDYFSTWLYMHGFQELANRLRGMQVPRDELRAVLSNALSNELFVVSYQRLLFIDEDGDVVGKAKTIPELLKVIKRIDLAVLRRYVATDQLSLWLMRKGYPELADQLRPIHGDEEDTRTELTAALEQWLEANPTASES